MRTLLITVSFVLISCLSSGVSKSVAQELDTSDIQQDQGGTVSEIIPSNTSDIQQDQGGTVSEITPPKKANVTSADVKQDQGSVATQITPSNIENVIDCSDPSSLLGGIGSDCLGTEKNDKMTGSNRNDREIGAEGDDYILGGRGEDSLYGNEGDDHILGQQGNDLIAGNNGEDKISGGPGDDIIFAGQEEEPKGQTNETEWPSSKDIVDCGNGNDTIYVDSLDSYKNCESVNPSKIDTQSPTSRETFTNLTQGLLPPKQ